MAEATAVFTWLRRRRTLGDMTTNESRNPATGGKEMTINVAADARGKQMNVAKLAAVACPEEFVGFDAPQHVELGGAFVDRGVYRQSHQHEADAVLLVSIVEAVLVEIERVVIEKAVHHCGEFAVQPQEVEPQRAALEGEPGDLVVKGAGRMAAERGALGVEAARVVTHQCRHRDAAFGFSCHPVETDVEFLFERADAPADVGAMRRAEGRQISIPRMA